MIRKIRSNVLRAAGASVIAVGSFEMLTSLPSEGRSSKFYHRCADFGTSILRSTLDAEDAHNAAIYLVKNNYAPRYREETRGIYHNIDTSSTIYYKNPTGGETSKYCLKFPNCIGLAAGFDKHGEAIKGLIELGFGFVEIGSVTPEAQPGNSKPRLFRLVEDKGVINRYGFNSIGLEKVGHNLNAYRETYTHNNAGESKEGQDAVKSVINLVAEFIWLVLERSNLKNSPIKTSGIIGVNLGKNKWRSSLDETIDDYTTGINKLGRYADYLVINISSPNTPGLRDMQRQEPLRMLLQNAVNARNKLSNTTMGTETHLPPLFVKIAPDLTNEEMSDIAEVVQQCGVDGIIVCNTTNSRPDNLVSKNKSEVGGLSGLPIKDLSTKCIRNMYQLTKGNIPIIGVGGVGSGQDAYEKLRAGASVVQLYSMLTYEGPGLVSRIRSELNEIMIERGHRSVEDIIGIDHDDLYWTKLAEKRKKERMKEHFVVDM
mmetsp:Transcript_10907/g.14256  ORF Transcript_10907/g.14256 Transcript_10907/m.14256 type:complete len:486 (-) Transcript_10907:193-1650(-)|eukprot:CAMPEP_0116065388 /NCGR_PEP_ID=MMETSP0322-20121206/9731_1 /TAXON_ID=163516 /ORGANISM="Leptocylindrus danicus var. apora, Strain B651" /LENGTH=485 /DNA_ID=CAMNT_0003551689 /DNA_START=101 /DNA_END=1558 /DNA_ORIENTATION=+